MALIGLSGYSGSGKDTFGRLIQYHIAKNTKDISTIDVISNYMENQWWLEEKSEWEKLPLFLKKIILYISSRNVAETTSLENYVEYLNYNSTKSTLLLISYVAIRE